MEWYQSLETTGNLVKKITDTVKVQNYLDSTDWVETYLLRHDLNSETIPPESNKWNIINKRTQAKALLATDG